MSHKDVLHENIRDRKKFSKNLSSQESIAPNRRSKFDRNTLGQRSTDHPEPTGFRISTSNYFLSQLYRIVPQTKNAQTVENVKSQMMKVFVNVQKIILVPSVN